MRCVVLIHGMLRGMGRQSECEMLAMKETLPGRRPVYSRCSVIEAPAELPDGEYTVSFDDGTVKVKRQGGLWLAGTESLSGAA